MLLKRQSWDLSYFPSMLFRLMILSFLIASILCSTLTILRFTSQWGSAIEIHTSISKIKDCISHIYLLVHWYSNNFLLRNTAKTKVVHFSSNFLNTDPIPSINIGAYTIQVESAVCDVGVVWTKHFDKSTQVNSICKSACLAISNIYWKDYKLLRSSNCK